MFEYIEPVEAKVVHIICLRTGEILKDAADMSRHFPEGNECDAPHATRDPEEKLS